MNAGMLDTPGAVADTLRSAAGTGLPEGFLRHPVTVAAGVWHLVSGVGDGSDGGPRP